MEYRLYSFAHSWLSGIQKGIQTQHATVKLLRNFSRNKSVIQWADKDQTTIVLEGGGSQSLENIADMFFDFSLYPTQIFYEDGASLNGSPTAVVVILPDSFYDLTFENYKGYLHEDLWPLFELVKGSRLAA